ncbi:hypothetical protein ACIKTA_01735 [Hansschlegelia beijingensis]
MRILSWILVAASLAACASGPSRPLTRSEQATIDRSVPHSAGMIR